MAGVECYVPPCTGHPPACNCTGTSTDLSVADCTAWQKFFDAMFPFRGSTTCSRVDPCHPGAWFGKEVSVSCENGTITSFVLYRERTGASAGTIPTEIGQLSHLESLELGGGFSADSGFIGTIPSEIARLTKLTSLLLESNLLTGRVPELPFAQYTGDCVLEPKAHCSDGNKFSCPLPARAEQCTYGKDNLTGVECFVPVPVPVGCSLGFNVTEVDFPSASCSGTPTSKATYQSGACEGKRFCCNHDGSIVSYAFFSDNSCCTPTGDAWNQTSGKCKNDVSQLFTCVKA
jgi:hypothetical protein